LDLPAPAGVVAGNVILVTDQKRHLASDDVRGGNNQAALRESARNGVLTDVRRGGVHAVGERHIGIIAQGLDDKIATCDVHVHGKEGRELAESILLGMIKPRGVNICVACLDAYKAWRATVACADGPSGACDTDLLLCEPRL